MRGEPPGGGAASSSSAAPLNAVATIRVPGINQVGIGRGCPDLISVLDWLYIRIGNSSEIPGKLRRLKNLIKSII
jgi:hypothetical protein